MMMEKSNNTVKTAKKGRFRAARKILPFFAPLFLAQISSPATESMPKTENYANNPTLDAIKFSNFEMSVYKLHEQMGLEKQGLRFEVFNKAVLGYLNLKHGGQLSDKNLITIVDFDKPSTDKRLWIVDLDAKKVLYHTYVAHGNQTGDDIARAFSNINDSNMSSLGFYVTGNTYMGKHGLSLKLDGMDEGFNTNANMRNIVVHGAEYVSEDFIQQYGRLGRSQGCPALPMELHDEIITQIKDQTTLFLHGGDRTYKSKYLNAEVAMHTFYQDTQVI